MQEKALPGGKELSGAAENLLVELALLLEEQRGALSPAKAVRRAGHNKPGDRPFPEKGTVSRLFYQDLARRSGGLFRLSG